MTRRRTKVKSLLEAPPEEEIELLIEDPIPEPEPLIVRQLTFLSRQIHTYLGKDVVVMLDETGSEYLVEASRVDLTTIAPQPVDVSFAMIPYAWEKELEALAPDLETVHRNFRRSFYRAGAFDRSALQTRARNDMFDSAYPYKQQLFAGE